MTAGHEAIGHIAPLVREQTGINMGDQLAFPFYSVQEPTPLH